MKKNYIKITLDLLMSITFVLLMNPRVLGGLPFHEIAGLVIGVAILTHIGLNYRWVLNTLKKIFDPNLPKKTRFNLTLNILLLVSMSTVIITGILISKVVLPSLAVQGGHSIRELHGLSADAALALVGLHVAVHWQWIMSICKKAFKTKEGKFRKGVIAPVVLSLAILAGGMQWFASTASSSMGDFKSKQMQQSEQAFNSGNSGNTENSGNNGSTGSTGTSATTTDTQQGPPNGDFRDGKFHGKEGHGEHGGGSNPFLVILNYFAIWAAIIIPVYYLEKRILRKKRKSSSVQLKVTL